MAQMDLHLQIDPEFQRLIPPLTPDEYKQLEHNLLQDGCREPISVWHNVILDGHNRYEICTRREISFTIAIINLPCREAAISWICANQIGRRNITEETRKYLIGKRYEAEKMMGPPNALGVNRGAVEVASKIHAQPKSKMARHFTAVSLGNEYHIAYSTVQKYAKFASALDRISEREKSLVSKLLTGEVKVSQENLVQLASLPENELSKVCKDIEKTSNGVLTYREGRKILAGRVKNPRSRRPKKPNIASQPYTSSIKDMPAFDPDAEISSLALTIPSWRGSIERVKAKTNMCRTSAPARKRLFGELIQLLQTIDLMLKDIREDAK